MKKRLKNATERQKILQTQENEFKQQLREKWNNLSAIMESYLNTSCEYLTETVTIAGETTKIYTNILDSLQSEIRMLSNSYKTLSNNTSKSGGKTSGSHIKFNMTGAVNGSTEMEENKPKFLHSSLRSATDYSGDLSSLRETMKTIGKIDFTQTFPQSMHHVAQSLQYTTTLNHALEKCLEIGSTEEKITKKNIEKSVESLKDFVGIISNKQKKNHKDDEEIASEIRKHYLSLKEFSELLFTDEKDENDDDSSSSAVRNKDLKPNQFKSNSNSNISSFKVHEKLVHPHTGELTENAIEIMKKMKETCIDIPGKLSSNNNTNYLPLLLSSNVLKEEPLKPFSDDQHLTVDQMIDHLVDVREPNIVRLTSIFLRAYRYFMNPDDLLEKIIYRYCAVPSFDSPLLEPYKSHQLSTRLRTVVFVKYWLTNYSHCDFKSPLTFKTLKDFIEDIVIFTGYHSIGKQLQKLINQCNCITNESFQDQSNKDELLSKLNQINSEETSSTTTTNNSDPLLFVKPLMNMVPVRENVRERKKKRCPSSKIYTLTQDDNNNKDKILTSEESGELQSENSSPVVQSVTNDDSELATFDNLQNSLKKEIKLDICILDYDPIIFAEQLTSFQFCQFKSITEIELLQQRYSKDQAPNITSNSQHFNRLGAWILYQILTSNNLNKRVKILRHILSVCIHLYYLNNFNGVISIVAALNNSSIDRLRVTWREAGRNVFILKESFANLTRDNYLLYRKQLQNISPPCIPFIGMFLTDLTYLEDGNANFLEDGSVNFSGKFTKISNAVSQILGFQDFHYSFDLDNDFSLMFSSLNTISEEDSYSHSEALEPRKITSTVDKFASLTDEENILAGEILQNIRNKLVCDINDVAPLEMEEFVPVLPDTDKQIPVERKRRISLQYRKTKQSS